MTEAISKQLSYVLRHRPDAIGIALDRAGWVAVDELLAALARHGIDAAAMAADGHRFWITPNPVWLTTAVPPRYLRAPARPGR